MTSIPPAAPPAPVLDAPPAAAPPQVPIKDALSAKPDAPLHVRAKKWWLYGLGALLLPVLLGPLGAFIALWPAHVVWKATKDLRKQVQTDPAVHETVRKQIKHAYILMIAATVLAVFVILSWLGGGAGTDSVAGPASSGCVFGSTPGDSICWRE